MPERHLKDAMATALSLDHWTPPKESLCAYDDKSLSVNFLCMDQTADEKRKLTVTQIPRAARYQEIFLDLAGWYASQYSDSKYRPKDFLDDRFHSNLSDDDEKLKDGLLDLLSLRLESSEAFNALLSCLQEDFGLGNLDEALQRRHERRSSVRRSSIYEYNQHVMPEPDLDASKLLQDILLAIRKDESLKSAAAMSGVLESPNEINYDELKEFLLRHRCIEDVNVEIQLVIEYAHRSLVEEFTLLFDPSHVFVCNTSVCDLACDAFLCPVATIDVDSNVWSGAIWRQWQAQTKKKDRSMWDKLVNGDDHDRVDFDCSNGSVAVPKRWSRNFSQPLVLPTTVVFEFQTMNEDEHIERLMKSALSFLKVAYDHLKNTAPLNGRERHLFALPVIGTGEGGARDITGKIVANLLSVLEGFVSKHRVDCVIVAADDATYVHAQTIRHQPKSILNSEKVKAATDLAGLATSGQLSLFLGAGTSIPSGLPSWNKLLEEIQNQLPDEYSNIGKECNGNLLMMADRLEIACTQNGGESLNTRVANLIENMNSHPSLVLALVLSLPSKSIVTTNYDRLIETACRNQNVANSCEASDISILPHQPKPGSTKCLLKMHGCISKPEKIVLSGKDYEERTVLTGIFQANLLTTHLLFCGFSLKDPNYRKVLEEVRDAMAHKVS